MIEKSILAGGNIKGSFYQSITEGMIDEKTPYDVFCDMCVFEFIANSGEMYTYAEPWKEGVCLIVLAGLAGSGNVNASQQETNSLRGDYTILSKIRRLEFRRDKSHPLYKYQL